MHSAIVEFVYYMKCSKLVSQKLYEIYKLQQLHTSLLTWSSSKEVK